MTAPSTAAKRKAVTLARSLMAEGKSLNAACRDAAKQAGVTMITIRNWAESLGEPLSADLDRSVTEKATAVKAAYDSTRRLQLVDKLLTRCEEHLDSGELSPRDLTGVATALAIGIDKRRLEEGASTDRHEWSDPKAALEAGYARLRMLRSG